MNILISGVSSGFGKAMTERLIAEGHQVIGIARRQERLAELKAALGPAFFPIVADIRDQDHIRTALTQLPEAFREIAVLINNAGLALGLESADQTDFEDWRVMIETNVMGAAFLTHLVLPEMVARNDGYIINIGSTAGNYPYFGGNVYGATKAFLKQFSLNLRADLFGKCIRVTNIEPGLCDETEFSDTRFKGDHAAARKLYQNAHAITGQDIANTVFWLISQPKHFNVNRIELMPTSQSFAGLCVHKEA